MTTSYRLTVEHVLALLDPEHVINACGINARRRRRAWRIRTCPGCGAKPARDGAAIYSRKTDHQWCWTHHGHACGGDLLDLIAAAHGIDRKRQLPKLLEIAAPIAGIAPADPDIERRIRERIEADRKRVARETAEREAAIAAMPARWDALAQHSDVGEQYLAGRGIDTSAFRESVRFASNGDVAVALCSLETGAIVGIQFRGATEKRFYMADHSAADESALCGRLAELDPGGVDVAVVVEGLADTLAARAAFPGFAVFGAAGAGQLENVAEAVAARVHEIGGWMLLSVDDDQVGIECGGDAILAAVRAGLVLDKSLHLLDLGGHHDFADAHAAGWRWTVPT